MKISKNIIKLREKHNLDKMQFCEIVGISRRTLERWEKGERVPELKYIKVIVDNFYISDVYKFMFSDRFEKSKGLTQVKPLKKSKPSKKVVATPEKVVQEPEKPTEKPKTFTIPNLVYIP